MRNFTTSRNGFTLVEMMVVIAIIGVLATALYTVVEPYMARSRDTKRVTDMLSYRNILDAYEKNFETFPSNTGSGGWLVGVNDGYCLSELGRRTTANGPGKDQQFMTLNSNTTRPPQDPILIMPAIDACPEQGSFFYSRIKYGTNDESEVVLMAARMEQRPSGNYGTGSALTGSTNVQAIIDAKKGTVPDSAPDALYVVSIIR